MAHENPLITGKVARLLHVAPVRVLGWIRAGNLNAYHVPGGRHRIDPADFRKFLADNQSPVTLDSLNLSASSWWTTRSRSGRRPSRLGAKGYRVFLATDGRDAFRLIEGEPLDFIFLDILLPAIGGASFVRAVKRHDPEAMVVFIAGYP